MPMPMAVARANRSLLNRLTVHFAGRVPPFALLEHRGRKSGTLYRTPLMLFQDGSFLIIVLTYGERTDWLRNLQASGDGVAIARNQRIPVSDPVVERGPDALQALPRPVRLILRLLRVDQVVRLTPAGPTEPA